MLTAVGTKVEVLASTAKKKGAKPRAGSQGYCVTSDRMQHLSGTNVIVIAATIIFTKYGGQYKRRNELKNVCLVYPKDQRNIKNVKPYLNKVLKNTKDYSAINLIMRAALNKKKVVQPDLMVVRPVITSETILNSENEFSAWLRCILTSLRVRSALTSKFQNEKALISENFLKGLPCTLVDLVGAINDKKQFTELAKFFFERPAYLKVLTKNVAGLNQFLVQGDIRNALHPLQMPWKSEISTVSSALVLGNLERPLTPEETAKFHVRLNPSTHRAYKSMWNWLDVLKTL